VEVITAAVDAYALGRIVSGITVGGSASQCAETAALARGERVKRFVNVAAVARRKLRQLEIADRLGDLRVPPGNRLEALKGDRVGQHSMRVNDQFRVCFRWAGSGAEDVEIVDYHCEGEGVCVDSSR